MSGHDINHKKPKENLNALKVISNLIQVQATLLNIYYRHEWVAAAIS
jgi:hypothetical protein